MTITILNKKIKEEELKEFTKYLFVHRQKDRKINLKNTNKKCQDSPGLTRSRANVCLY